MSRLARVVAAIGLLSVPAVAGTVPESRDSLQELSPRIRGEPRLTPPHPLCPLATKLQLATDLPTLAWAHITDGIRHWTVVSGDTYQTDHVLPLVGFRAGTRHWIRVRIESVTGQETLHPDVLRFDAAPVPPDFPVFEVTTLDPSRQDHGLTVFCAQAGTTAAAGSVVLMTDSQGQVVWYYDDPEYQPFHVIKARGGNLLLNDGLLIKEVDLWGDVHGMWYANRRLPSFRPIDATPVNVDSFHHELIELPEQEDADFLAISTELRQLPDYPIDETNLENTVAMAPVVGDVLVEFRRDGKIVRKHSLLDSLDPYRVSYDSLGGFYNGFYGVSLDWSHSNAVIIDPADGNYIVSVRHQDAIVKLERRRGKLLWILGDPRRWNSPWSETLLRPLQNLAEPFEWPFHQHAPKLIAPGRVVVFDNGNHRAIPPEPPMAPEDSWSRVVEYTIDEEQGTVRQSWSYGDGSWYSSAFGNVDVLPNTGNILVTDGARVDDEGSSFARIFELTPENPPGVVFELVLSDPDPERGWTIYRAARY